MGSVAPGVQDKEAGGRGRGVSAETPKMSPRPEVVVASAQDDEIGRDGRNTAGEKPRRSPRLGSVAPGAQDDEAGGRERGVAGETPKMSPRLEFVITPVNVTGATETSDVQVLATGFGVSRPVAPACR